MAVKRLAAVVGAVVVLVGASTTPPPSRLLDLDPDEREARLSGDASAVVIYRDGLRRVIRYLESRPSIIPATRLAAPAMMTSEEKEAVRASWRSFLDYQLALDSVGRLHGEYYRLSGRPRAASFRVAYASFLAPYRAALELFEAADRNPAIDVILNEPIPELGLPANTYARLKFRHLNVARAAEFAALEAVSRGLGNGELSPLASAIREDAHHVWKAGHGRGEKQTARNALRIVQRAGFTAWFPVQAGVAEWMGDTKVHRRHRSLVSPPQIEAMAPRLEPGDVLLERREWYLSNVGLPGFWPHAAVFIGTAEERRRYFDDPDVDAWVRASGHPDLEALLRSRFPSAHARSASVEGGHPARVIEAISEGVSFTTLEHSADADSVAVLRPRLGKKAKAMAIVRAFSYAGRPYDFDFDFLTDRALVCTELVYKAFEPQAEAPGLRLSLVEIMGRQALPANELVRVFDEQHGTAAQQMDLVLFLDGEERGRRAVEASLDEFRQSWRRPKWHVLMPDSR